VCEDVCVRVCEKLSARLGLFVYVCVCVQESARAHKASSKATRLFLTK